MNEGERWDDKKGKRQMERKQRRDKQIGGEGEEER